VISPQTKRISEQTQTAGNGDINDVMSEVRQAVEKPLIHHGLITAFVSGTAALTTTEHEAELIHLRPRRLIRSSRYPSKTPKSCREIGSERFRVDAIRRRGARKLICNS